jgi:O-antigen ligase
VVGVYLVGLVVSITLAEAALGVLAIRWLWRLVNGRARGGWPLAWPVAAFVVATIVAASLSARPAESLFTARDVLLLASVWILRDALPGVRAARAALLGVLALLGIVSVVAIVQVGFCAQLAAWAPVLGRVATKCHRAHGLYSIYMTLAGVSSVVLLATLPELLWTHGRPRWAPVAWLVGLVAFALTYVRGAWVGFAAGATVLAGSLRRGRGVLLGGLIALAIMLLLLPGIRARVRSMADPRDPTSSERVLMWRSGLAIARDHWLVGVGPEQVKHVYPRYAAPEVAHKHRSHLHSSPLQILVERGVLGVAAWLWLFAMFFAHATAIASRVRDDAAASALVRGAIAATAGFLVAGLFEHNFGDSEVLLTALFVMTLAFVADPEGRPRNRVSSGNDQPGGGIR